jgi:long-chain acyl-CoA synthetase
MTPPVSPYAARPWLARYDPGTPADADPPADLLTSLRAAVEQAPDRRAVAYFDGGLSYADLDRLSSGLAAYLRDHGFTCGDRLAVYLQNIPQYVIAVLAAWKAGGIVVPVNPMYREAELANLLADSGAAVLICLEPSWHAVAAKAVATSAVHTVLTTSALDLQTRNDPRVFEGVTRQPAEGVPDLLTVARATDPSTLEPFTPGPDDAALLSYTSGTSGVPKGATNTHGNIAFNAEGTKLWNRFPDGAVIFGMAPLFHITGMVCHLASALRIGGTLALAYRFEAGVVLDAIREHRPYYTVGPTTAYLALMNHPDASPEHFASLEQVYSGGAPLPPAVVDMFRKRFGHHIHNGYGLTETSAPCIVEPPDRPAPVDPASGTLAIGVPVIGTLARIVGDDGAELPVGETGEIQVKGPMVVPGYWGRPNDTAAALHDGWLSTGDVGFMDADGWFYVVDRKKDMINASGFKVWPREVEDVLYTHDAVREAAVVGVPDSYRGETVKAYVSTRAGVAVEPAELVAYCRDRLAAYKCPRQVEILPELPKTLSGKILRRELRDQS